MTAWSDELDLKRLPWGDRIIEALAETDRAYFDVYGEDATKSPQSRRAIAIIEEIEAAYKERYDPSKPWLEWKYALPRFLKIWGRK